MSKFRPKVKSIDSRNITLAYHEAKVARMVANGTDELVARDILGRAKEARAAKREQRRLTGAQIRELERG